MDGPNWNRYAGVSNETITMRVNGLERDQTIDSVSAKVWAETADPSTAVTLTATVVNTKLRRVRVALGTWLQATAVAGVTYRGQLFLVIDGAGPVPWPEGDEGSDDPGYFTITVHPSA